MNKASLTRMAVIEGNWLLYRLIEKSAIDNSVPTAYATKTQIKYNEAFMDSLSLSEQYFIMCHEARHILYRHCDVMLSDEKINRKIFNVAADVIINEMLKRRKLTVPSGSLLRNSEVFKEPIPENLETSMEVYEFLMKQKEDNPDNQDLQGNESFDLGDEDEESDQEIESMVEVALSCDPSKESIKAKEIAPKSNHEKPMDIWSKIKAETGRLTNSIMKRNFRREGRINIGCITPNYRGSNRVPKVKVFIDASGSMSYVIEGIIDSLNKVFVKGKMYHASYYCFDTRLAPLVDDSWKEHMGGTNIDLVADNLNNADLYVVITDCEGDMEKLNDSKQNLLVFTNNKHAVRNYSRIVEVDDEFNNILSN